MASEEVFQTLRQNRGHSDKPPPTISDGWGGIREAMVQTWGKVPEYKDRGRPPEKKRPLGGWKYLQVIKERNEKDRVTGTKKKAIFGEKESLLELFEEHTAYVERTHLTMRQMNGRLIRTCRSKGARLLKGAFNAPGSCQLGRRRLQPDPQTQEPTNRSNRSAERPAWTTMEKANACNGRWAHRSGVVDRETAPNRANYQHIIGPPPDSLPDCQDTADRIRRPIGVYRRLSLGGEV